MTSSIPSPEAEQSQVALLIPVKSTAAGKSRLTVTPDMRRRLALAMALDTVCAAAAAEGVGRVIVLAESGEDAAAAGAVPGVETMLVRASGLNSAIEEGLRAVPAGMPAGVLPADLPSLQPAELDAALAAARRWPLAVVPDHLGTGTTLLVARTAPLLRPRYGPDSLAAHRLLGAAVLDVPADSGLRRDVDLLIDLPTATGPRTSALVRDGDLAIPAG